MGKTCLLLTVAILFLWTVSASAVNIDPYDNILPPDGLYSIVYGNYYAADLTDAKGNKLTQGSDFTVKQTLLRAVYYKHLGKAPIAFQVILPVGEVSGSNERSSGIGDIMLCPGIFLYNNEKTKTSISLWTFVMAPTGDWDKNRNPMINMGGNHWIIMPQVAISQISGKVVYDMNVNTYFHTRENDTQTQLPDRLELEMSLGYQVTDKLIAGINGGGYWDLANVKVAGTTVPVSRAERHEIGPSIGYSITDKLTANFRWTHDVNSRSSTQGDNFWLRVLYIFD